MSELHKPLIQKLDELVAVGKPSVVVSLSDIDESLDLLHSEQKLTLERDWIYWRALTDGVKGT